MAIRVEFFGIARERAGQNELKIDVDSLPLPLGEVLRCVASRVPMLGRELIAEGKLHPSLAINVDGARFVRDPQTMIRDGQSVLILSADAGG